MQAVAVTRVNRLLEQVALALKLFLNRLFEFLQVHPLCWDFEGLFLLIRVKRGKIFQGSKLDYFKPFL